MKLPFGLTISRTQKRENTSTDVSNPFSPRYGGDYNDLVVSAASSGALSVATAYRCIDVICNTVAALDFEYLKKTSGIFRPDTDARVRYLLTVQPNPFMSAYEFKSQTVRHILTKGEALIVPVYSEDSMDISYLFLASAGTWSHDIYNHTYTVHDLVQGISGTYGESEVIHIMNLSADGQTGLSVLSFARLALGTAAKGDKETYNRFANGGNVRGIVSNDASVRGFGEYADSELKKTAQSLDERFRAGERIVNLPGQAKFDALSLTSVDLEFLQTRKFSVREICRFFGVPPTFVYDDTSNNYKSAEMASVSFMNQTIGPMLAKIENEFNRKLVPEFRAFRYRYEFDKRGAYALDLLTKASYQKQTIESGVYSINDWRRYENQPEVENGDEVLVSANLKSLNTLLTEGTTEPTAPSEPTNSNNNEDE